MDGGGHHAVVMGAGMAGLVAARVLSDAYERVTVIERDTLPSIAESRKGVLQVQTLSQNARPTSCRDGTRAVEGRDGDGKRRYAELGPPDCRRIVGGQVATIAALEHPELVRTLSHYEPAIPSLIAVAPEGGAALAQRATLLAPALAAAKSGDADRAVRLFVEGVFALPPGGFDRQPESLRTMALDNARTVLPMVTAPPPPPVTCERMGMLTTPTHVMKGANTQPWYSMMAEALARCVPDGRLTVIPGSKHDGPVRNAPDVSRVLMGFLDSH